MMIAWQYGLMPPEEWGEDCETEMAQQVVFWNRLIGIERAHRAAVRVQLVSDDAALAAEWDAFDALCRLLDETPRRPPADTDPDMWRARIAEMRQERGVRWAALKPQIAAARGRHAVALKAAADRRYAAFTEARNASGLWWGNYNAVCAAFDVALGRLAPGDELRDHSWDSSGRLTNQIMGGIPAPVLVERGHAQVRIDPLPAGHPLGRKPRAVNRGADNWRRRWVLLTATVYSRGRGTRRMAAWPMMLHRDFPPGAVIKSVAIHRRRISPRPGRASPHMGHWSNWHWTATFSCEVPDVPTSPSNLAVGIDVGWRQVEGGFRVATIAGSDGALDHIVVPIAMIERREALAALSGKARRSFNDGDDDSGWHQRHALAHGLAAATAARREFYRIEAKRLTERYGLLAIDRTNTAVLSRRGKRASDAPASDMPPVTRRRRTWVSPAELIAEIERAAKARGCRVLLASGKSTLTCHRCGHVNNVPENWRADLIWRCSNCRGIWDQDENAARNLLAAALDASAGATLQLEARENKGLRRARMTRKGGARKLPGNLLENNGAEVSG